MAASPAANPSDHELLHLLWINAGLSCDGDSVSLTNATLPSVEDIVMGAIPGLPKVSPTLAARRLSGRRRFHAMVLESGCRRAGSVRSRGRGIDSEREHQDARATGLASATTRPAPAGSAISR